MERGENERRLKFKTLAFSLKIIPINIPEN